eukprot:3376030-Ditylum_brightwellii.AAC.1
MVPPQDDILQLMDTNANIDDDDQGKFVPKAGLYDLIAATNRGETLATYICGTQAIDCAFDTERIVQIMDEIGLIEFLQDFQSDHKGLFLNTFTCNLFS